MADATTPTPKAPEKTPEAVGSDTVVAEKGGIKLTQQEYVQQVVNPTVEDKAGMERIIGPALDNWTAAPVEATEAQKKSAKERSAKLELARETRLAGHETGAGENKQYDSGSQTSGA